MHQAKERPYFLQRYKIVPVFSTFPMIFIHRTRVQTPIQSLTANANLDKTFEKRHLKKAQFKRVQIYFLYFIMLHSEMQLLRYVLYKLGKRSLVYVPFIPICPCYKPVKIRCKVSINCTECFFKRINVTF